MRRTVILAVLALIGMLFCVPSNTADAGATPTITSVIEGVDPATDQVVVLLLGKIQLFVHSEFQRRPGTEWPRQWRLLLATFQ